ncbi:hypothetical protein EVAR_35886_1 [Eumeta japonica]|uniref:Uncharacterized protein n=1 Tax=Eumeta variegata TaxID=151549 RepID=A0A4C1WX30_EUMVA|nr:hypothetical protein EVAR_35886_1 [Eumeta japonica]
MLNALYSSPLLSTCTKAKSTNTTPSTHATKTTPTSEYPSATLTSSIPNVLTLPSPVFSYGGLPGSPYSNAAPNPQIFFSPPSPTQLPNAVTGTINSIPTPDFYSSNHQIVMPSVDYQYQNIPNVKQSIPTEPISYDDQYKFDVATPQQCLAQTPEGYSNQMNMSPTPPQYILLNEHMNAQKQYGFTPPCSSSSYNQSPQPSTPSAVPAQAVLPQNPCSAPSPATDYNVGIVTYSTSGTVPPSLPHPIPRSPVPTYPVPGHQMYPIHCPATGGTPIAYPVQTST